MLHHNRETFDRDARAGHARKTVSRVLALKAATIALAVVYVASTLPTPLYTLYEHRFGFSQLVVTEIYAVYLLGNLGVLLLLGHLSDQIGRRPVTIVALGAAIVSTLFFFAAHSALWLFLARGTNGFAAGLGASTLTAWIAELEPRSDRARAALIAVAGNLAGLAFGALLGGVLARALPWPLRTCYGVYLALLGGTIALVSALPETVERRARSWRELSLRPRIGVPSELRRRFIAPASIAFATLALSGFYAALVPGLLTRLGQTSPAVVGGVVAAYFGIGTCVAAAVPTKSSTALRVAIVLMIAAVVLLVAADLMRSFLALLFATLASGGALAFGFRGSLQTVNEMAPSDRRAELVSAYLLACYTGNALPVLGVGWLGKALGNQPANAIFAAVLIGLGLLAFVAGRQAER
ncbi:MAG TPA: MFS transporter [Polyangiaceae bacterium]|jgi:MFS family permease|nr:MFS transporter [Polyangiaceae bacterium]